MEEEYPLNSESSEGRNNINTEEHVIDDSEIEALRDKAFTPEFRELVSKITGHSGREKDVLELSRDELLQKYHILFYRISNLLDLDTIDSSFNQFAFHEDALFDSLCEHVRMTMKQKGFPPFAFISFDFEKSSYLPVFHTLADFQESEIVFDIHENLIRKIFASKSGILLKSDEIEEDLYLRKRMACISDNPECAYYFCAVRTIADRILGSGKNTARIADVVGNSAVMMISFNPEMETEIQKQENIFNVLVHDLSLHLVLLNTLVMKRQAAYGITGLERSIHVLDYLYAVFRELGNGSIYVLRCNECSTRELYYTFRYLQEKVKQMLSGSSALMRVGADTAALFLCEHDREAVLDACGEYLKLFPNAISFHEWDYNKIFHFGIS